MADSLHPMESYEGSQTRITMKTVNKANFICSFKEIQNFPFNTQICSFKIFVSGTDNLVTRLNMISVQSVLVCFGLLMSTCLAHVNVAFRNLEEEYVIEL